MTVAEIIDEVLGLAYPRKFGGALFAIKEHHVYQGLTELQRRVEGFRAANIDIVPGTFEAMVSGATILPAPRGVIEQVAVGNEECQTTFCDLMPKGQIQQKQADWSMMNGNGCGTPDVHPVFPQHRLLWARDDDDLMIYPWVPTPWQIAVRWRGIRRDWLPESEVWWGDLAIEALRTFVLWKTAVDENCDIQKIQVAMDAFVQEAAKLKTEDFQTRHPAPSERYATDAISNYVSACKTTTEPEPTPEPVEEAFAPAFSEGFATQKPTDPEPEVRDATTAKGRNELDSDLNQFVNDNTTGDVTPSDVRMVVGSSNYSAINKVDETTSYSLSLLDVPDAGSARAVLGLGNSATQNVGTAAGTVAAGDHTHDTVSADIIRLKADNGVYVNLYVSYIQGIYTLRVGQPV